MTALIDIKLGIKSTKKNNQEYNYAVNIAIKI